MKTNNFKLIIISLSLLLLSSVFYAGAQMQGSPGNNARNFGTQTGSAPGFMGEKGQDLMEKAQQYQEKKDEMAQRRCEMVQTRIKSHLSKYETNERRYRVFFNGIKIKLENLIDRYNQQYPEIDTSDLESYLAELENMILDIYSDYETYVTTFEDTEGSVCGESIGDYRARMKEAFGKMQQVREDVQSLRDFYVEYIKPELEDLREQRRQLVDGETEEVEETEELE